MRRALLVAWREYAENAKTKGFWIGLLLLPAILFISVQVPMFLEKKGTPTRHFVVVDQSGELGKTIDDAVERHHARRAQSALSEYAGKHAASSSVTKPPPATGQGIPSRGERDVLARLADRSTEGVDEFIGRGGIEAHLRELASRLAPAAPPFEEPRRLFQRVPLPQGLAVDADFNTLAAELKPFLRGERTVEADGKAVSLYAAFLVPRNIEEQIVRPGLKRAGAATNQTGIEYWSSNLADEGLRDEVQRALNSEIRRREYVTRGLDLAAIQQIEGTHVPFASLNPKKQQGQERVNMADVMRQWAPTAFVYLLWIAIFTITQMLLNNTIEEKSNRTIEVLLSSITPGELMTGKLIGIAAVGLTMVGAWVGTLMAVLAWKAGGQSGVAQQLYTIVRTSNLVPSFIVYFLFGYVLYATLILALGSLCNTLKEAQNYMAVITLIMVVPLLTMMFIPKDPNGTFARALSWFPLYTPFVMMNRAAADPPWTDLIGTMVLLVASTGVALWLAGKIFRIGILRTGQPPRIIELIRWLRSR